MTISGIDEIREWLEEGKRLSATHMIVVCDTYDWDNYPVYVLVRQDSRAVAKQYSKDMQKVMEVYSYKKDLNFQLAQYRNFEYD